MLNIFGYLDLNRDRAAPILAAATGLDIEAVEKVQIEWAARNPLGDRTAFDAYVEYRSSEGSRGFLGIEIKYTDSFSATGYGKPDESGRFNDVSQGYRDVTNGPEFTAGAYNKMLNTKVNQLWRNAMLAIEHRRLEGFDRGHVVVTCLEDDGEAMTGACLLGGVLVEPTDLIRVATIEQIIREMAAQPWGAERAEALRRRYLDLALSE